MDGFLDMIGDLLDAIVEMLEAIFLGFIEAIGTGMAPSWWPTLHLILKQTGFWALFVIGAACIFFLAFWVLEKRRGWEPVPKIVYKVTFGIGVLGMYFYFLGAWGLVLPVILLLLVIWLIAQLTRPHR